MAQKTAVIIPTCDPMDPHNTFYLIWLATLTRKGIAAEALSREPTPCRLLGVRKTKLEAEKLAQRHGEFC